MATKCSSSLQQQQDCPKPKCFTGLLRDTPDHRDLTRVYGSPDIPSTDDHPKIDLRKYVLKVYDQGKLHSCTANVVCAAYSIVLNVQAHKMNLPNSTFDPSRLFVYYISREIKNKTSMNAGVPLRNGLKAIHEFGVCRESRWPYDQRKFANKPSDISYEEAEGNTIYKYVHIGQSIDQLRACLKEGFPFAFGYEVYDSFEDDDNGYMPIPSDDEMQSNPDPLLHGGLAVGYDDWTQRITVLNSWGVRFGDDGYFYMPYEYITHPDRAFDFWKIEEVSESL